MRELKFRAWDKLAKRFIYPDDSYQGHYILTLNGKFHNLQNGSGGNEYVVQQYAGLKDRNENDIYEGDIVRAYCKDLSIDVGVVVWVDCLFGYEISFEHKKHGESESLRVENLRYGVIGNICENPELICAN